MKYTLIFIVLLVYLLSGRLSAQTFRGQIRDVTTGENLIGAYVLEKASPNGVQTDAFGRFTLPITGKKTVALSLSYLGYETLDTLIAVSEQTIILYLKPDATLPTVEINARTEERGARSSLSTVNVPVQLLNAMPAVLGEADPIKSLQLLPGISAGVEGMADLLIRGGTPDQNLVLLDGAKIFNANHLFGLLSPVNPDIVKNIEVYKSGFPAKYGRRLSGVVEIDTEEGNKKEWKKSFGIGFINTRFQISGPLKKDKSSISIGGRTAHLSLLNLIAAGKDNGITYLFYDFNVKMNWLTDKSNFSLSFFRNYDNMGVKDAFIGTPVNAVFAYGNTTGSARWARSFGGNLDLVAIATGTRYNYRAEEDIVTGAGQKITSNVSSISDLSAKVTLTKVFNAVLTLEGGVEATVRTIEPRALTITTGEEVESESLIEEVSRDYAGFLSANLRLGRSLKMELGLRGQRYELPGTAKPRSFLEPRTLLSYRLAPKSTITGSYTFMSQPLHMISNNFIGIPTNLWVTANDFAPPSTGQQYTVGYTYREDAAEYAFEAYYKENENIIDPLPGVGFFQSNASNWEEDVSTGGRNRIFGLEFFHKRNAGRFFGWASYVLSWNRIQYDEVNSGRWYFRQFDRRHDLSLVAGYDLNRKWQLIGNFVVNSGFRLSLPDALYVDGFTNDVIPVIRERYNTKTPLYHRLDVTFRRTSKRSNGRTRTLSLGCYNAYGRQNLSFALTEEDIEGENLSTSVGRLISVTNDVKLFSLFTFVPFINYAATF
jgi:hypothetical protein